MKLTARTNISAAGSLFFCILLATPGWALLHEFRELLLFRNPLTYLHLPLRHLHQRTTLRTPRRRPQRFRDQRGFIACARTAV